MLTSKEEYNSLRQELMEHQGRRLPIISMALTIATILFSASVELKNPYLPLFALLVLHSARVQLVQAHYGVQRIAAYMRIMHEEDNPELNWESGSYRIRLASLHESKRKENKSIWNISPFSPLDSLILLTNIVAVALSFVLSSDWVSKTVVSLVALIGVVIWLYYSWKIHDLNAMTIDRREEKFWREFKNVTRQKRKANR